MAITVFKAQALRHCDYTSIIIETKNKISQFTSIVENTVHVYNKLDFCCVPKIITYTHNEVPWIQALSECLSQFSLSEHQQHSICKAPYHFSSYAMTAIHLAASIR